MPERARARAAAARARDLVPASGGKSKDGGKGNKFKPRQVYFAVNEYPENDEYEQIEINGEAMMARSMVPATPDLNGDNASQASSQWTVLEPPSDPFLDARNTVRDVGMTADELLDAMIRQAEDQRRERANREGEFQRVVDDVPLALPPEPECAFEPDDERIIALERYMRLVPRDHPVFAREWEDSYMERWSTFQPGSLAFPQDIENIRRWKLKARFGLPKVPPEFEAIEDGPRPSIGLSPCPEDAPVRPPFSTGEYGCSHVNKTRQGSNAYRKILKCKDCGHILEDVRTEKDANMTAREAKDCPHLRKDNRGTTGTTWRWKCLDCGHIEKGNKTPSRSGRSASEASGSEAVQPTMEPSPFTLTSDAEEVDKIMDLVKITVDLQRELRQPLTVFILDQIYDKCRNRVLGRSVGSSGYQPSSHVSRTPESRAPTSAAGSTRSAPRPATPSPLAPHTPSEPPPGYSPSASRPAFDAFAGPSSSVPRPSSSSRPDALQKIESGVHKGKTYSELYDSDKPYVRWIIGRLKADGLREQSLIGFATYCLSRESGEVYMALAGTSSGHADGCIAVIDSGCNNTCHGSRWMQRLLEQLNLTDEEVPLLPAVGGFVGSMGAFRLPADGRFR